MFRQLPAAFIRGISRLVFQRQALVGDFRKKTLSDATQPDKLLQHSTVHMYMSHIVASSQCISKWETPGTMLFSM